MFEGDEGSQAGEEDELEDEDEEQQDEEEKGEEEEEEASVYERIGSRFMKVKMQRTKLPRHKHIPFDVDCYVDEVQDILQEVKLTGLHCSELLDRVMVGVRAPTMLPPLDSQEMAQGCNAALFTLPVALAQKQKRQAEKKYGAKVAMHMEHAVVGSLGHAEILAEVIEEQGITLPQRPLSAVLPKMLGQAVEHAYANPHLLPDLSSDTESEEENEADSKRGTTIKGFGSSAFAHSIAPTKANATKPWLNKGAPSIAGGRAPSVLLGHRKSGGSGGQPLYAPSMAGTRRAGTVMYAMTEAEGEGADEWVTKNKARRKHKATLSERMERPEITWEMLMQAWKGAGLPGIAGQDGRCLLQQMERGSWYGENIRKSEKELKQCLKLAAKAKPPPAGSTNQPHAMSSRASTMSGSTHNPLTPAPGTDVLSWHPNGLSAALEMAEKKNVQIMDQIRALEMRRREQAGIRTDKSKSLYAGFLKKEDSQAGIGSIAEGDHEGEEEEEDEETALEAWQRQQMVQSGKDNAPQDTIVEAPTWRVLEPPVSDMMLLHRMEWWATLVADATVMQQISQQAIASRLKGRNKWTTSLVPVREKRRQEELRLLETYVDRFREMKVQANTPVRVGSAEIDYVTAEVRVHMQQDWCSLFKSEMFAWLNQYLTRGTLPSMADRPGGLKSLMAGTQGQDKKLSEKQQEQQAQWLEDTEMRMNAMQADAKMAGAGPVSKGVGSALKGAQPKAPPQEEQSNAFDSMSAEMISEFMQEATKVFSSGREAAEAAAKAFGTTIMYEGQGFDGSGAADDTDPSQKVAAVPQPPKQPPPHLHPSPPTAHHHNGPSSSRHSSVSVSASSSLSQQPSPHTSSGSQLASPQQLQQLNVMVGSPRVAAASPQGGQQRPIPPPQPPSRQDSSSRFRRSSLPASLQPQGDLDASAGPLSAPPPRSPIPSSTPAKGFVLNKPDGSSKNTAGGLGAPLMVGSVKQQHTQNAKSSPLEKVEQLAGMNEESSFVQDDTGAEDVQDQEEWLAAAAAQGREIVAGIALPRTGSALRQMTAVQEHGDNDAYEARDGTLPIGKLQRNASLPRSPNPATQLTSAPKTSRSQWASSNLPAGRPAIHASLNGRNIARSRSKSILGLPGAAAAGAELTPSSSMRRSSMPVYYDNYTSTMQNFYSQNGSLGEAVQNSLSPSENKFLRSSSLQPTMRNDSVRQSCPTFVRAQTPTSFQQPPAQNASILRMSSMKKQASIGRTSTPTGGVSRWQTSQRQSSTGGVRQSADASNGIQGFTPLQRNSSMGRADPSSVHSQGAPSNARRHSTLGVSSETKGLSVRSSIRRHSQVGMPSDVTLPSLQVGPPGPPQRQGSHRSSAW